MKTIVFNKPYFTGNEIEYITDSVKQGHISGNGKYTKLCQHFFEHEYGIKKALLTTSCTDALEMTALLAEIAPGDEVIIPSYTFVSTALAFVRQGAKIVFADSQKSHPNLDPNKLKNLITPATKAIVVVHYAGIGCDMDPIMELATKYNLIIIEDAAQAIDSYYKGRPLGSIGHMGTFSFHETKNITSGEGGLLAINDQRFLDRAEIIWEKGTNRAAFYRGEVNKYGWVDTGSSFLPSEIVAAFLWAQINELQVIQKKRKNIWNQYLNGLYEWAKKNGIGVPIIPSFSTNNGHLFYLVFHSVEQRQYFIKYMKVRNIQIVFHYLCLHNSPFYIDKHDGRLLPNSENFADCLVRLPLHLGLGDKDVENIIETILNY